MAIALKCLFLLTLLFTFQNKIKACESKRGMIPSAPCQRQKETALEADLQIKSAETITQTNNVLLKTEKRPFFSNIEERKDIFDEDYYENIRYKRRATDRSLTNLRHKLNEEKKKEELMAADAKPRLEPNYTVTMKHMADDESVVKHQSQLDKIHQFYHAKEMQPKNEAPQSETDCDFEEDCSWTWRKDIANGFFISSGNAIGQNETGPKTDAKNKEFGSFLLLRIPHTSTEFHVHSPFFKPTRSSCRLRVWIYQEQMNNAEIRIVADMISNHSQSINNHTQTLVHRISGDDSRKWKDYLFTIGKRSDNFSIILEVVPSPIPAAGANVAFDNLALVNCYPINDDTCTPQQYRCQSTPNCVNSTSICDITQDCLKGDDETQNCDQMPNGARCTFEEEDWCGWYNVEGKALAWTRHNGSTPTKFTGPNYDHTYMNTTGKYLYVNMLKDDVGFASMATLRSVIFNPPPSVHGNISSRYYNSCTIRFYLHQTGKHKSGIQGQVTELKPNYNSSKDFLWSYVDHGDRWVRQVFVLPHIKHRYYINFDVKRGIRYMSDIAIDDVSLSPECFGINIPADELNGYNYWNPMEDSMFEKATHSDFINSTHHEITSCGVSGRYGPTASNCSKIYNTSMLNIKVLHEPGLSGMQKWTVPTDSHYTFILFGGSGGKGSEAMGSSRGAMVRIILELRRGQEIIMLPGQTGSNACEKTLNHPGNSSCEIQATNITGVRGVYYMDINDGGGGGGGATYLFLRNKTRHAIPLAVAAGGGGIGLGKFSDSGYQHGQTVNMSKPPVTGNMYGKKAAGAGGGWKMFSGLVDVSHKFMMGMPLLDGAIGGKACYNSSDGRGNGGFGGGGGGCRNGGGGGGYAGGDASGNSTNGFGGYSFIDVSRGVGNLSEVHVGFNDGPGYIYIIPAISGCDCDFRCVALNTRKSLVSCICPSGWKLDTNGKTCIPMPDLAAGQYPTWFVVGLIAIVICLTVAFAIICFILYNRYQYRASGILRRKMLSGADLQLDRLRMASDGMMTEYNPNYEFGGVVYTLKDLKDIPREQLRLVKALGQGAFGEVYQGFYRQRPCDTVEMPVAVKTLPEMSTSQAEMDFLMEALIMSKFNHPNIVHFIGVCFDKHPRFIVLELLAGGDLKNFLRESRPKPERGSPLSMKDLILISIDVAKGCNYLENNRFIHRDIAARNCLLTTKGPGRVVKIADFGMSRDVYRSDYYRKGGKAMLPIKWMPPEAFLDGIFTSKTDVWSFGVLLWEIMSMGYMPYTGCANREVMQLVTSGGRLDPPANCPGPIYGLMTQCWHPTPEQRPNFDTILERLGYCLQDPQVMSNPLPVFHRPPSNERDTTVMRPLSSDDNCLQVIPSSDYLIPNHSTVPNSVGSTSSVDKLLPENADSWETSFIMPNSKSTQPLLTDSEQNKDDDTDRLLSINNTSSTKISPESLPKNISNHNKNLKNDATTLKTGLSLDPTALMKQSAGLIQKKYANVNTQDGVTGNGVIQNGSYSVSPQTIFLTSNGNNARKLFSDSGINC